MTTTSLSVLVLDDEEDFALSWKEALEEGATEAGVPVDVKAVFGDDLGPVITQLYEASRSFRDAAGGDLPETDLDAADVLVIDADLRDARDAGLTSGLDLAYSARCFSNAAVIIVLNAFGENTFDLTLVGHRRSYADIHLGAAQLGNRGLWTSPSPERFRPWSWPLIDREVHLHRDRVTELLEPDLLDRPIVELLGFESGDIGALSRGAASYLTAAREKGSGATIDLVSTKQFLLTSEYGLLRRDAQSYEDQRDAHRLVLARAGAARIAKWVNCVLAPAQDVLVDAPHLSLRYPSLLPSQTKKSLDATTNLAADPLKPRKLAEEIGLPTAKGHLRQHRFAAQVWANRPLWWGRRLAASDLPEAEKPWTFEPPDLVFCEDSSKFWAPSKASRFSCDLETPYRIRFIEGNIDGVAYRPSENLVAD